MPKIHQRVDGSGHYIKTAFEGKIVTYQVTTQGETYLKRKYVRGGDEISRQELLRMLERGYIYTGGSGPGDIDPSIAQPHARQKKEQSWSQKKQGVTRTKKNWSMEDFQTKKETSNNDQNCCCCTSTIVMISLLPITILSTALFFRHQRKEAR